ncbi:MAG: SpoIID/LytB domain-containing protein [Actinomycetota bacterium]|nr:SpoIID/LytB domain-containing protein [Actinomycetota bacterium]
MLALAVVALLLGAGAPAVAHGQPAGYHGSVQLVPASGDFLRWDGRRFGGRLEVRASLGGLAVIEHVGVEDYLMGIEEVPLSWPMEALRAQAVAARTYLAWTFQAGRAGAGATHGFDICATDACQVYRGIDQVGRPQGDRWVQAVRDTAGEILLYEGRPAQALYSSTSGGRTRSVQDVFEGSPPLPYLQGVESPGEDSPFVSWQVELASWKLADVLREAGYLVGPDIGEARVVPGPDGSGPWQVRLWTGAGEKVMDAGDFRRALNVYGPARHPGVLPALRPDGERYPQAILSYTFSLHEEERVPEQLQPGHPLVERVIVIEGSGWGHQVGMSQYGAKAMADRGAGYRDILAHYYGGLRPQPAGEWLPEEVAVGLDWELEEVSVSGSGPVTMTADGQPLMADALGDWTFLHAQGLVGVVPPEGFGLPPTLTQVRPVSPVPQGRAAVIRGMLSTPSELRLVMFRGAEQVGTTKWEVKEAGSIILLWDALIEGEPAVPGRYSVLIEGRAQGEAFRAYTALSVAPGS